MYHIAVIEDETAFSDQLQLYLKQYQKEHDVSFKISLFADGAEILEGYRPLYDLILLDIEMPKVNGMEAAKQIRLMDPDAVLMFITNMATYAIRSYEVGALDFVLKPITYYTFSMKLTRVLKRVQQKEKQQILLKIADGVKKIGIHQIYYVEVQNRMLYYYTDEGEYVIRGTMKSAERMLAQYSFVRCNHWYIVNLMHVSQIRKNIAVVGDHELEISRRNQNAFLKALTDYMGGIY